MPFFAVYVLLFADSGLSDRQISGLLVLWSVVAIVCEVPSGAWADVLPRRLLLLLAAVLYAGCFACWVLVPSFWGFAAGFALWGLSGALSSGTFQALAFDELAAAGRRPEFGRVVAWGSTLALAAVTLATFAATPLFAAGGYALVGWVSVGVCGLQFLLVLSLPETSRQVSATDVEGLDDVMGPDAPAKAVRPAPDDGLWRAWWTTLVDGVRASSRNRVLRGGVLASATLMGLLAFDEYFGLLLREQGVPTVTIPLLLAGITIAQAAGSLAADRAQQLTGRVVAGLTVAAGLALAAGMLTGHPIGVVGVGLGYGTLTMLIVLSEIRLQHVAPGHLRATVTSTSNVLAELLAVLVYVVVAVAAPLGIGLVLGMLALGLALLGPTLGRWIPDPPAPVSSGARVDP